jgi:hypothetical protein
LDDDEKTAIVMTSDNFFIWVTYNIIPFEKVSIPILEGKFIKLFKVVD